jgi:aspartate/methionine/tyrosine aminotransferase
VEDVADPSGRAEAIPWSGIRKMFNLADQSPDAVNLCVGQPGFDTPSHIIAAATRALEEGQTQYTPGLGIRKLREAISRKAWRDNGVEADADTEVMVTAGAMEGVMLSLLAVVDLGDDVVIGDPCYTNYPGQIELAGGRPVTVPVLESNGFRMDPGDIESAITQRTRLLMINSPANPTGTVLEMEDLLAIAEIARRRDIFVLSDEPYERLTYDGVEHISLACLPGMKERTISVFTLSKTYAMTGFRLGYVVGPPKVIDVMHKLQEDVVSCIPAFVQQAGVAALDGPQDCVHRMVEEYDRRRKLVVQALNRIDGVSCLMPRGAFYAFPNVSNLGRTSEEVALHLLESSRVVCVPGTAFGAGGEGHLRLSYASSMEHLEEGLSRITKGAQELLGRAGK